MAYLLSDGTKPKKGLVVVVLDENVTGGNDSGAITEIVTKRNSNWKYSECAYIGPNGEIGYATMTEETSNLRKATPEEELIFKGK